MTSSINLMDYNVKLLGLLPLSFDFSKDENHGIRFQTRKLKQIKKPSEDRHDGQVVISDENLIRSTAVVETKIIHTPVHTATTASNIVSDDGVTTLASEVSQKVKVKVKVSRDENGGENVVVQQVLPVEVAHEEKLDLEPCVTKDDDKENDKTEIETLDDGPEVDKTLKADIAARFLYKCNGDKRPDFLSHRLSIIYLAMNPDPYFIKVNKIRFKPYGCEKEMEFIQIQEPIEVDNLYEKPNNGFLKSGWSGEKFNKWATEESNYETVSSHQSSKPTDYEATSSLKGDNAVGQNAGGSKAIDDESVSDSDSYSSSYHYAYLQAEIKPKSGDTENHQISNATRGFNLLISALVGGVWKLEEDPANYTCQHLAEMRTVKEETLYGRDQSFFYKRVSMLRNYWQCYLAGEKYYLVGVNGLIQSDQEEKERREIKELRLYEVSKIPDSIKKSGAEQGFMPWRKKTLESRLYKSLCVIFDKVTDAPAGTEFMFVKYNKFDLPVHDVDGSITRPYLLALRQLIVEGLPTPLPPKLMIDLTKSITYEEAVELFLERKFTREDLPETEEKESCLILTFKNKVLAHILLMSVESYLKKHERFPADSGMENLKIKKVTMKKLEAHRGNNTHPWINSNEQQQRTSRWNNTQQWRNSNDQQQQANRSNYTNQWRNSNHEQQQENRWSNTQFSRNPNIHQPQAYPLNDDNGRRQQSRQYFAPSRRSECNTGDLNINWRQK